jgi:hypothetical protein
MVSIGRSYFLGPLILLSLLGVTIRRGLDGLFGFIDHLYAQFIITSNTALRLISAISSSLLQTLVSSVYYSLHYPFTGNGF